MKILVASHTYIVPLNCEKLKTLANLDSDIQVITIVPRRWRPGGVQNQTIETQPMESGNFQLVPVGNWSQNNQGLLTFKPEIIRLLKQFQPDIIQVEQGSKSLAYAQLISLNKLLNLKAKNLFFTWWNLPYQSKFPVNWLENYNLTHTDGIIAGNQDGANILREHGYGGKIKVMPQLGVDETLFAPAPQPELAQQWGIEPDDFVIGFVGRFVAEKGILTLIQAASRLPESNWKLLLLGRGELKDEIQSLAAAAGIGDRLIIVDSVPHDQVYRYINLMSTLVLPSETTYKFKTLTAVGWKEQFGHVIIEAMACKVPIIGSDSGEIPHVIGDAGLIFPEADAEALCGCLTRLMQQPQLAGELGEQGYQKTMNQYTNRALAEQQLDFYRELVQQ